MVVVMAISSRLVQKLAVSLSPPPPPNTHIYTCSSLLFPSTSDVTVYFNQSSYTISEGEGPLEVCVAIDEEVGINLHVALSSQDGTAKGTLSLLLLACTKFSEISELPTFRYK